MKPPIGSRYEFENTPAGRLAAIAQDVRLRVQHLYRHEPDFADFRDAFKPYVAIEILRARLDEARKCGRGDRVDELERELVSLEEPDRLPQRPREL